MNPARQDFENNYELAFKFNTKAYQLGHPEGASNIGLLYEMGWGVQKDSYLAEEWYLKAIDGYFHSAQAELRLTRLYLSKPSTKGNVDKALSYIKQARKTAILKSSLWCEECDSYINEADFLESQLFKLDYLI